MLSLCISMYKYVVTVCVFAVAAAAFCCLLFAPQQGTFTLLGDDEDEGPDLSLQTSRGAGATPAAAGVHT